MKLIDHKIGKAFPPGLVLMSWLFLALGITAFIATSIIGGAIVILISLILITSTTGVQIDPQTKRYKNYSQVLGLKMGSWTPIKDLPDIVLLRKNLSASTTSYFSAQKTKTDEQAVVDICLASSNHRQKVLVARIEGEEEARGTAEDIAEKIGSEVKPYNPQVSSRSRRR